MVDRTFIQSLVTQGFNSISGLTEDVSFSNSSSSGFDFSTLSADTEEPVVTIYQGIIGNVRRDSSSRSFVVDVVFNSSDIDSVDQYDTATFRNKTWKVVDYYYDGYTTTVTFGGS